MKSLIITGTLITEKTARGYIKRMAAHLLGDGFDLAACQVLEEIETKVVNAGLLTWEEIGNIEAAYMDI